MDRDFFGSDFSKRNFLRMRHSWIYVRDACDIAKSRARGFSSVHSWQRDKNRADDFSHKKIPPRHLELHALKIKVRPKYCADFYFVFQNSLLENKK